MRAAHKKLWLLGIALAVAAAAVVFISANGSTQRLGCYDIQLDAAERTARCFEAIRSYRTELGMELAPEDVRKTGMIGEEFTDITTSVGSIESKRTAADPDMSALFVRMLTEAGLKAGDRVGAGFSGSFPSLNIALICACDAMGIDITYISSIGASFYGANHPDLTFPDMAHRLYLDGLISTDSSLVTPGGDYDNGKGVFDEEAFIPIIARIKDYGIPVMREENYQQNLANRRAVYDEAEIDCFVAVGGNISSTGLDESALSLGQGLLKQNIPVGGLNKHSGLVQYYLAQGLPVINMLNLRQIVADYSMPFDPPVQLSPGESPAYWTVSYPKLPIAAAFIAVFAILTVRKRMIKKK
ncbi:MAG: poly-gamma-glutamate system protein [Oscillospiraceae bacterium]|nr:poly-gamma-glutamate system protein [Oscillospiraceae bacterium]